MNGQAPYDKLKSENVRRALALSINRDEFLRGNWDPGMATVVKLGKEFEVVAANQMGDEMFVSSPVIVDGDLFLRSQDELFAISED